MPSLRVLAGANAFKTIQAEGLQHRHFDTMIGAIGGPKWFVLYGLDQYLLTEFFKHRQDPVQLLGSSAGAWRFGCYSQTDGATTLTRFCHAYRSLDYPRSSSRREVTEISAQVLDAIFPTAQHAEQCLNHPFFRLNFIVARGKGLLNSAKQAQVLSGLTAAAAANLIHRRHLGRFVERVLCHHPTEPFAQVPTDLPTQRLALSPSNIRPALFASGSIPLVLDPVHGIPGAEPGYYVDGGLTDYHFSWPLHGDKFVLYPHFSSKVSPGWFDKSLSRRPTAADFRQVVMLVPSDSWVQSLPGAKIPDRKDFTKLAPAERLARWKVVTERSFELADDLRSGRYQVEPLAF